MMESRSIRAASVTSGQAVPPLGRRGSGGAGRTGQGVAPLGVTATRRARSGTDIIKRRSRVWIT